MRRRLTLLAIMAVALIAAPAAMATPVTLTVVFSNTCGVGCGANWAATMTTTVPGVTLTGFDINLTSPLLFDPTGAPPGIGGSGLTLPAGVAVAVVDGGTVASFTLAPGTATGVTTTIHLDVDDTDAAVSAAELAAHGATISNMVLAGVPGGLVFEQDPYGIFVSDNGTATAVLKGEIRIIPEPSTFVLMGAGMVVIGLIRRRKHSA